MGRQKIPDEVRKKIGKFKQDHPCVSNQQLADLFGVCEWTIRNIIKPRKENG